MHLGSLSVLAGLRTADGQTVAGVGKPSALLVYLSAAPGRESTRGHVASLLWADLEPDAAKHALRQTLWYLKKKTGQDLIIAEGDNLRLSDAVTVDRDELLAASRAGDHHRVVELYTGPFIPNFAAPGSSAFEEWAALERRRLLEVFRHSAEAVIANHLTAGRPRDAVIVAKRLRDQDLYNESGWRLLIEACLSANDMLAARSESEALQQLAEREEMALEPSTRAVLRSVQSQSTSGSARTTPTDGVDQLAPSLVGREEAFSACMQAWESTRSGKALRLHITARAGYGKTRLLRDVAARIRAMRGKVITLGGSLGARDIEYTVAGDLAAALASLPGRQAIAPETAATLVDLNPSLSTWFDRPAKRVTRIDLLRARTLAIRELMATVAFEHPVAILIDDLHWWDDASAALIAAAIEGLTDTRVLVVTAGRTEARKHQLVSSALTTHLALDPLTAGHIEELVLSIAALPGEGWATTFAGDLWKASRGSPLLALEMLQHLEAQQLLRRVDGLWATSRPEALTAELQQADVLRARLADLDRTELWLLTLLAVAGGTLDQEVLVAASERSPEESMARLAALEARGLVLRDGAGWRTAHDEIADEALRVAPRDATVKASVQLGRALGSTEPFDEGRARRAAQLLRHGDDFGAQTDLFRAFCQHRFALGDRRSVTTIAGDLLGAAARPAEVIALGRSAPLSWRFGVVSTTRRIVAGLGAVTVAAGLALGTLVREAPVPTPDAVLAVAYIDSAGHVTFDAYDVRQSGWSPQDTLLPRPWAAPPITLTSPNGFGANYSPTTRRLVTAQAVAGLGTIDLFLYEGEGPGRPFLPAERDDVSPTLSPDGRLVAFATARWDSLMRYDIAVAGINDTMPRRLTAGPTSDVAPYWSPDGSRLAFTRFQWGAQPSEICVIEVDTSLLECRAMRTPDASFTTAGWLDSDRLALASSPSGQLTVLQWSTGEDQPLIDGNVRGAWLSPDADWVLCTCALQNDGTTVPAVVPVSAPNLARPLSMRPGPSRKLLAIFWITSTSPMRAATARMVVPAVVPANVPVQLRAIMRDERGRALRESGSLRWSIVDSRAGVIDSLRGILTVSGTTPSVQVTVTSGRSASDTVTLPVTDRPARLVFEEEWRNGLGSWMPFGYPVPTVASAGTAQPVFLTNGDGSFQSGAVAKGEVSTEGGVAMDFVLMTPITMPQWQGIGLALVTGVDTTRLHEAAGKNPVPGFTEGEGLCGMGYPEEGRVRDMRGFISAFAVRAAAKIRVDDIASGRPWRLRLQLFPDGRCGVAVDGKPLGIINGTAPPKGRARISLAGNSYNTRIAVGAMRVYEGVLTDLDWSRVPVLK